MLYIIAALIGFVVAGLHGAVAGALIVFAIDMFFVLMIGLIWVVGTAWQSFLDYIKHQS